MVQRRIEVCNNDVGYTNQYKEHETKRMAPPSTQNERMFASFVGSHLM